MFTLFFVNIVTPGFVPGPVQNLKCIQDADKSSLTLQWEKPNNAKDDDVITYDIRFRPSNNRFPWASYEKTVVHPTTKVRLTKEDGLEPLKSYDIKVRAKNADGESEWSKVSEYTGTFALGQGI